MLVRLTQDQLEELAPIAGDGSISVSLETLTRLLSKPLQCVGLRASVASVDYLQHDTGEPETGTRALSGIWWLSHGDDTSLIGGFVVDGRAMTITTEGENESPLAESIEVLDRATRAIASQYDGATVVRPGDFQVPLIRGVKLARVVVTRDHRIRRPQDILTGSELAGLNAGHLGLAVVQTIGGNKALVIKHGI